MTSFWKLSDNLNTEQKIVDMYRNKKTIEEIHQQTSASIGKIYRTLEHYGIKGNRLRKDHDKIYYYHNVWGLPVDEIAEFTKYSSRWVRNVLKRESNGS